MGTMLYVMAILGCGDGSAGCRQVRIADTLYQTQQACEAASGAMLTRNTDIDYPVISTRCTAQRADSARRRLASLPRG